MKKKAACLSILPAFKSATTSKQKAALLRIVFFDGAMNQMVVSFLDRKELSAEDLDELQRILDKKRKK